MLQEKSQAMRFLPETLEGWVVLLFAAVGSLAVYWRSHSVLMTRINGVGGRVAALETSDAEKKEQLRQQDKQITLLQAGFADMVGRLARVEKAIDHTDEHVTKSTAEILAALSEFQVSITEDIAGNRERIVRLETISEIERKLGRPLHELKN